MKCVGEIGRKTMLEKTLSQILVWKRTAKTPSGTLFYLQLLESPDEKCSDSMKSPDEKC